MTGLRFAAPRSKLSHDAGGTPGEAAILQLAVFALLVAAGGVVSWFVRRVSVSLAFAVLFAVDGAYQSFRYPPGAAHASLSALAAIAFCAVAWVVDQVSPEA